jgi:hypothetical protein
MNFKEFEDGLQVEIEISEKVVKSLMRHLPALHHIRFRACPAYRQPGVQSSFEIMASRGPAAVFPRPSIKNFLENEIQFL